MKIQNNNEWKQYEPVSACFVSFFIKEPLVYPNFWQNIVEPADHRYLKLPQIGAQHVGWSTEVRIIQGVLPTNLTSPSQSKKYV